MITLIAAIGKNSEIGFQNKLLWSIPEDMAHFKAYTTGKVVIMGRKTFASIGRALPGRKSIVITTGSINSAAITAKTIDEALSIEHCYPELVIIGGASIYEQTINTADKLVITHVDVECEADTFFPKIDPKIWKVESEKVSGQCKYVEYSRIHHETH